MALRRASASLVIPLEDIAHEITSVICEPRAVFPSQSPHGEQFFLPVIENGEREYFPGPFFFCFPSFILFVNTHSSIRVCLFVCLFVACSFVVFPLYLYFCQLVFYISCLFISTFLPRNIISY